MRVLLDIKDEKVPFIMEVLKNFKFVKVEPLSEKEEIIEDIKQGVKEVNQIRAGKLKGIPIEELLNEL